MSSRYESLVLDSIPAGCKRALDVGCGNGGLTRALRDRGVADVTGLDRDQPCIERCRSHPGAAGITYLAGDLLTQPLAPGSFDLVSAVASLHHMDARAGLTRLATLVAPGGALVVVGLARPDLPNDVPIELAALLVRPFLRKPGSPDGLPKPPVVWPAPERYGTMRRLARELIPGARYRRRLLWRYTLVWLR